MKNPHFDTLQQRKQHAIAQFRQSWQPQTFFRQYTRALDEALSALADKFFSGSHWCLLAIGGYGRQEVYPHSDLDLAFITRDELSEEESEKVAQLVQTLWDMQLAPALKSGNLKELLATAREDLTAETAFLEARFLAGNREFADVAIAAFRQQMDIVVFIENKLVEMQQRHTKQPALVLEPNIKNGAGGLRDLHTMKWLAQAQGLPSDFYGLMRKRILTRVEANLLQTCHKRLARLRIELHLAAGREEDRLIFDLQGKLAAQFGLNPNDKQAGIEHLMRIFYRTAKTVMQLNGILLPMLRDRMSSRLPRHAYDMDTDYFHVNGMIAAKDLAIFHEQPEHLFKIVEIMQKRSDVYAIAPKTLRAWWSASRAIDERFYQNETNRRRFLGFFQAGEGLTHTLRLLNLYGILARYLPEWHKIVGLLQHDLFHIYPVDDHILTVLRNMRRLAMERHSHELPFASSLFHNFPQEKQYVLYLATLFHDIAKGRGGDHAQLGVLDAQRFARDHFMPEEHADLLAWLVEDHLLLSMTAQKEDIQDPAVIARFCERVQSRERLAALYLLTVADIRGTNPKIWNSWKAQLLQSLFHSAEQHLTGHNSSPETATQTRRQKALIALEQQLGDAKAVRRVMQALGDAYFVRHSAEQILWYLQHIAAAPDTPIAAVRQLNDETLQALVFMPNADRLFTRLCRIFSRHGFSIAAARAFITAHDFILDTFTVTLPQHIENKKERDDFQAALLHDLQQFARQPLGESGIVRHKPTRRARLQPITPQVHIYPDDEHPSRYSIDIIAPDRPYLLADLTEIFARHQISLIYAKISTLGERAEDSFIVVCHDLNTSKEYALRQDLLAVL
ncbi:[protein-PII] uridylyltransferase [Neisseriaceae bacterium B1]